MRLRQIKIKNFRKIEDLTIDFPKGLSVIVGENNAGKTAVIDAIRLMLFTGRDADALRLNEDDFRKSDEYFPIEIVCTFTDLLEDDEVHFIECLVDVGDGKFEMQLNARAEFNVKTRRANLKMWGGATEGGSLASNLYDRITAIYLQPLRDPESGLRPGRNSQVSRLLNSITDKELHVEFEDIAKNANDQIKGLDPVKKAKKDVDTQMNSITGAELAQQTELIFSDPSFHRIIAGLEAQIDGLSFALNGLGYNNLVFTAMTLGTLKRSAHYSHRSIVIEEPEAHLHPHLQVLLLQHLVNQANDKDEHAVQVIVSSHSPVLVSQAPLDSIVAIQQNNSKVNAVSICALPFDLVLKSKLQRFLDATRAELFFARRILMVEGVSEALLIPILAKATGGDLKKSSVTLLNADGINFNAFIPLLGPGKLELPVVILTDGDDITKSDVASASALALKAHETTIPNLRVEYSSITFEHELAKSPVLLPCLLRAFTELRPELGEKLIEKITAIEPNDLRADAFLEEFLRSKTSKGQFAQELATILEGEELTANDVPEYIRSALVFLGVTNCAVPE